SLQGGRKPSFAGKLSTERRPARSRQDEQGNQRTPGSVEGKRGEGQRPRAAFSAGTGRRQRTPMGGQFCEGTDRQEASSGRGRCHRLRLADRLPATRSR